MTLEDWLTETKDRYQRNDPVTATKHSAQELAVGAGRRLGQRWNYGENMWEEDWDVLILLDACRADLMQEVAPAWDFLPYEVPSVYSPASMSEEWLEKHATPGYQSEMEETALVAANAFTRADFVSEDDWAVLDEVWKHSWDDEEGTVLPRSVTDAAIHHWRDSNPERMIVWYLQPHGPFVPADWSDGFRRNEIGHGEADRRSVWMQYRDGDISHDQLWSAYRANLQYVLDDVDLLLENLDAEDVVISADHANGLGEWGVYDHPKYVPAPAVKRVPWVETHAKDMETYHPEVPAEMAEDKGDPTAAEVNDRLEALGYK